MANLILCVLVTYMMAFQIVGPFNGSLWHAQCSACLDVYACVCIEMGQKNKPYPSLKYCSKHICVGVSNSLKPKGPKKCRH
jgi:hypothetical protein